jgi:hypothetical protein
MAIEQVQFRRGTASTWTSVNPTLGSGEPGYETDTGKLKIGDGVTLWNSLPYWTESLFAVDFEFPGPLSVTTGKMVWTSPFPSATILSARCSLGRGSAPASQPVIADVLISSNTTTPTYSSIYSGATPNPKPQVAVGLQIGTPAPPNITALGLGYSLSVDIDQVGGGATPTDHDLIVTVLLFL